MAKTLNIEELKAVVLNYAWDSEECCVDYDAVFAFLTKFDLLNVSPNLRIVAPEAGGDDEVF